MITTASLWELTVLCQRAKVDVPESVDRALHLFEVAGKSLELPARGLLSLEDDAVDGWIRDLSLRTHSTPHPSSTAIGTVGLQAGVDEFTTLVLGELAVAIGPEVETLIDQLRPRFDETAAPIVAAVQQYDIGLTTTADEIVERRDPAAAEALVNARDAWQAVQPILSLRQQLSLLLDLSPTYEEAKHDGFLHTSGAIDFSVCFAAGDGWSRNGRLYVNGKLPGVLDLFALAEGGLRLNSPAEVQEKQTRRRNLEWQADHPTPAAAPAERGLVAAGGKYPTS